MKVKSIFSSQASCSVIIAAAVADLFPDARVLSFQATEKCFFCDLDLPFPFEKEMIPLLEERMRRWVKKDIPFQRLEMMPANAAQFLEHHGNRGAAQAVRLKKGLVDIVQLDHFAGESPGSLLRTTSEVKFFKLVDAQQIRSKRIRLLGTAAFSKDELKIQVEECKGLDDHLKLAEELRLLSFSPAGWIWLPRGEFLKKNLMKRACQEFSGSVISTPALSAKDLLLCHSHYIRAARKGSVEFLKTSLEGSGQELLDASVGTVDRFFLPLSEESVISFLQIITKFLKIFAFDYEVVIVGKSAKLLREALKKLALENTSEGGERSGIEFHLRDALGRTWPLSRIWLEEKEGVVVLSLFHSLERFAALLLEKTKGNLPFWLQSEQVRILAMDGEYAEEVRQTLLKAGFRAGVDREEEALAGRMRRSLHERVPFSIVVGGRERKTQELTVRQLGNSDSLTMNLETLISRLRQIESQ